MEEQNVKLTKLASCGGCGASLTLSVPELQFLEKLGQIPFLPVARKAYDMLPVNVVMPADQEEMALTVNGKKKNIRKKCSSSLEIS